MSNDARERADKSVFVRHHPRPSVDAVRQYELEASPRSLDRIDVTIKRNSKRADDRFTASVGWYFFTNNRQYVTFVTRNSGTDYGILEY